MGNFDPIAVATAAAEAAAKAALDAAATAGKVVADATEAVADGAGVAGEVVVDSLIWTAQVASEGMAAADREAKHSFGMAAPGDSIEEEGEQAGPASLDATPMGDAQAAAAAAKAAQDAAAAAAAAAAASAAAPDDARSMRDPVNVVQDPTGDPAGSAFSLGTMLVADDPVVEASPSESAGSGGAEETVPSDLPANDGPDGQGAADPTPIDDTTSSSSDAGADADPGSSGSWLGSGGLSDLLAEAERLQRMFERLEAERAAAEAAAAETAAAEAAAAEAAAAADAGGAAAGAFDTEESQADEVASPAGEGEAATADESFLPPDSWLDAGSEGAQEETSTGSDRPGMGSGAADAGPVVDSEAPGATDGEPAEDAAGDATTDEQVDAVPDRGAGMGDFASGGGMIGHGRDPDDDHGRGDGHGQGGGREQGHGRSDGESDDA